MPLCAAAFSEYSLLRTYQEASGGKALGKKSSQFTAMLNSGQEAAKDEKAESGLCSTPSMGGWPQGERDPVRRERCSLLSLVLVPVLLDGDMDYLQVAPTGVILEKEGEQGGESQ